MELRLMPTHPDRFGGLGFLAGVGFAFSLLLLAQGAVLAGDPEIVAVIGHEARAQILEAEKRGDLPTALELLRSVLTGGSSDAGVQMNLCRTLRQTGSLEEARVAAAPLGPLDVLPVEPQPILDVVAPLKDVDCFHPENVGLLSQGRPRFLPCTPSGVQQLLIHAGVTVPGSHVAIVGRSDLVGRPLALTATGRIFRRALALLIRRSSIRLCAADSGSSRTAPGS
jgi:type IV secretory pathway protease TraF